MSGVYSDKFDHFYNVFECALLDELARPENEKAPLAVEEPEAPGKEDDDLQELKRQEEEMERKEVEEAERVRAAILEKSHQALG